MFDIFINNFEFFELPAIDSYSGEEIYQYKVPIKNRSRNPYRKNKKQSFFIKLGNIHNFNPNKIHFKAKNSNVAPIMIPVILIKECINMPNIFLKKTHNIKTLREKFEKPEEKIQELTQNNENITFISNDDNHAKKYKNEQFSKLFLEEMPFNKVESFEPFSIICQICLSKSEDYNHIGCKDNFCTSCIFLLLENYITSSYVFPEELLCPSCLSIIPDELIKKISSESLYNKMLEQREKLEIQKLVTEKKAFYCPINICEGFGYLLPNEKITACKKCKFSFCIDCNKSVHPLVACEVSTLEDSKIEDLIQSQNWKKCPNCGVFIEKIHGCQFVKCNSSLCKGVNALCYLCGKSLNDSQHFSHYKTKGPCGNTCNTLDGIDDEIISNVIDYNQPGNNIVPAIFQNGNCNIF
ncbi:hypothetical protein SteCoe_34049 [Stentor coeruleus]|uniref:RBR-type E3 ubiquitin transferase n=1 Tax=Stentor coeruleus TaxID=5963 RepID=A0A1R2AVD0_9CILI|nr:hypothetical protein SteCoe_34049 [Stentor coeruleus]